MLFGYECLIVVGDSCNIYLILAYTVSDVMNYLMDRVMLVEMS